jgi:hypothetical protein
MTHKPVDPMLPIPHWSVWVMVALLFALAWWLS